MASTLVPDRTVTDGFVLVHRTLLDTGRRLSAVLQRRSDGEDLPALARLWDFYRSGLDDHHAGERDVVFPRVAGRDPDFAGLESSMAREHDEVHALLDAADRAVEVMTSDRTPSSRRAAAGAVEALIASLTAHLEHEERVVIPRVVLAIPADEMIAIERGFLRKTGASRIAMTVVALEQTAGREGLPMPPLPLPARLALPLWRRRYRRMLAAAGIDDLTDAS